MELSFRMIECITLADINTFSDQRGISDMARNLQHVNDHLLFRLYITRETRLFHYNQRYCTHFNKSYPRY